MRHSQTLIPTLREVPGDAELKSHALMLRAGYIRRLASGIYSYLPLALRTVRKIERIVRDEMEAAGAAELLMPTVLPAELWKETGRWDVYGKELLRFRDRHERGFCMGPTHEEVITDIVRKEITSWRQLPKNLFQIQTKFRDEIRPRFGLMRGREFIMKDSYSFDLTKEASLATYKKMVDAYCRIFSRCGLKFRAVEAATGAIGGSYSHEFQVLADSGEDLILSCNACDYAANIELAELPDGSVPTGEKKASVGSRCPRCKKGEYQSFRGIEVGQVFYLGTKYSKAMAAVYKNEAGEDREMEMGCYGIGIGRTAAAAIEQNHDDKGIIWPPAIAPYSIHLLPLQWAEETVRSRAEAFYSELKQAGFEVLLDDRPDRAGVKFNDADLIGLPWQLVVGTKGIEKGEVEVKERRSGKRESLALTKVLAFFKEKLDLAEIPKI